MFRHLESGQRLLERTDLERDARIVDRRRRALDVERAGRVVRTPLLGKTLEAVEPYEARAGRVEVLEPPPKRPPLPDSELQVEGSLGVEQGQRVSERVDPVVAHPQAAGARRELVCPTAERQGSQDARRVVQAFLAEVATRTDQQLTGVRPGVEPAASRGSGAGGASVGDAVGGPDRHSEQSCTGRRARSPPNRQLDRIFAVGRARPARTGGFRPGARGGVRARDRAARSRPRPRPPRSRPMAARPRSSSPRGPSPRRRRRARCRRTTRRGVVGRR